MKISIGLGIGVLYFTCACTHAAWAESAADYLCYWQKSDGSIVNLQRLCDRNMTNEPLSADAAFVAGFQSLASRYPANIRQDLESYIHQNRDSAIASAKVACRILKLGGTNALSNRSKRLAAYDSSPSAAAKQEIITPLAISHYCPETAQR